MAWPINQAHANACAHEKARQSGPENRKQPGLGGPCTGPTGSRTCCPIAGTAALRYLVDGSKHQPPLAKRVYQLRVELQHIAPPVWRRILVPGSIKLAKLNRIVQAAMGWTNSHLHD